MDKPKFDYVVARKWDEKKSVSGNLSIYAYHHEIQHGDEDQARDFLEYVKRMSPDSSWVIYKVDFTPLTVV